MRKLRLILGDQLNHEHSWYKEKDGETIYVLMEVQQEMTYVTHHIQKIIAFFLSMRAFAEHLELCGHKVVYLKIDDEQNKQNIVANLNSLIERYQINKLEYLLPDEYRLDEELKNYCAKLPIPSEVSDTEHFITGRSELKEFFEGKKQLLMESFYRMMRKRHHILMDDEGRPIGGTWNYDKLNRTKLPKSHMVTPPLTYKHDVKALLQSVQSTGINTIGEIDSNEFIWPINRKESLDLLDFFLENLLPYFGTFQDAMTPDYWSLYHSRLSFSMNVKLLSPMEVIRSVQSKWIENQETISISQAEGFIRQILGWREYMRGIYWKEMPRFGQLNYFNNEGKLPSWFWTGHTKMSCMSHSIKQSLKYAYAHHIQRLMVTGNFASLTGIDPDQVDHWYLGIYIDAIEWVELTNTRGMSQFADGGIVGSKPYVSSGNYIKKMSNYCDSCYYNVKDKTGDKACPFNALYWHFMARNRSLLEKNPRIGMAYRTLDKMTDENKRALIDKGDQLIDSIEEL